MSQPREASKGWRTPTGGRTNDGMAYERSQRKLKARKLKAEGASRRACLPMRQKDRTGKRVGRVATAPRPRRDRTGKRR